MKKFWNKAETTNDIYIYGDIMSYGYYDDDVTAKSFAEDLKSCGGLPVTVHINSGGGDCFSAMAIYNTLKAYGGEVTISIDGVAASAASLIALAGNKTCMASNALMMMHTPQVGLFDFFDLTELATAQNALTKLEDSIVGIYQSKTSTDVRELIKTETWLSAQEAKDLGFVDEITGEVSFQIDDAQHKIFVNSLAVDIKKFNGDKIHRAIAGKKTDFRQLETSRIRALLNLRGDNSAVNSLIDVAIKRGDSVEQVKPYIDAAKNFNPSNRFESMIRDQMNSGAENVRGGQPITEDEIKAAQIEAVAQLANKLGGKKSG